MLDRLAIRELIENWVLWRDGGDWERFAMLWHPEGRMITTWFEAPAADFIARSRRAWDNGMKVLHGLDGSSIEVAGTRAVAQTKMRIMQRGNVHGVLVDVICHGRFWDALEKLDDAWRLRLRQPIYEMDTMIPLDPTARPLLNQAVLESFPEGYRHLAYLQTQLGFDVSRSMPGTRGPEIDALGRRGRKWLVGDAPECLDGLLR